jgi:hypothetical protein
MTAARPLSGMPPATRPVTELGRGGPRRAQAAAEAEQRRVPASSSPWGDGDQRRPDQALVQAGRSGRIEESALMIQGAVHLFL